MEMIVRRCPCILYYVILYISVCKDQLIYLPIILTDVQVANESLALFSLFTTRPLQTHCCQ